MLVSERSVHGYYHFPWDRMGGNEDGGGRKYWCAIFSYARQILRHANHCQQKKMTTNSRKLDNVYSKRLNKSHKRTVFQSLHQKIQRFHGSL